MLVMHFKGTLLLNPSDSVRVPVNLFALLWIYSGRLVPCLSCFELRRAGDEFLLLGTAAEQGTV